MSRIQGIFLLLTIALVLSVSPTTNVQTTAKPFPVTTLAGQTVEVSVDWCCVARLACCVQPLTK